MLVLLLYCTIVFRRQPSDTADGPPIHSHTPLETVWTLVPLAIVPFPQATYGGLVLHNITSAHGDVEELEIRVTAFQWGWRFEYPAYGITSPGVRLPSTGTS